MGYVIVNTKNRRLRDPKTNQCYPYFEFPEQAMQYIKRRLGGSPGAMIKEANNNDRRTKED